MPHYEYNFNHSKEVIQRLANEGAETPPQDDMPVWRYVDMSLRILGKTHLLCDQRIQREFLQQQSLIHDICEQKQHNDVFHTTQLNGEFRSEVYKKIDKLEVKVDNLEVKVDNLEVKVDNLEVKVDNLEVKVDNLELKFDNLRSEFNKKFAQIHLRLDRLEGNLRQAMADISCAIDASHNRLRVRGWDNIHPVRTIGQGGESGGVPTGFPKTVRKFWALKLRSRFPQLVELVRSYCIRYEDWHREDIEMFYSEAEDSEDESSSPNSSVHGYPLVTAVELYPEKAHRAVAARLGLDYDEIKKFMDSAAALQQQGPSGLGQKRANNGSNRRGELDTKRPRFKEAASEEMTDITSPGKVVEQSPSSPPVIAKKEEQ